MNDYTKDDIDFIKSFAKSEVFKFNARQFKRKNMYGRGNTSFSEKRFAQSYYETNKNNDVKEACKEKMRSFKNKRAGRMEA